MIERLEGTFFGYKDVELFYQVWRKGESRGTIVVTHGLAEHSENYHRFATAFAEDGWTVIGWDLRGHGKSEGKRGYVEDFADYCHDLDALVKFLKSQMQTRGKPLFLFGHSMGGLITIKTVINHAPGGVTALCLSSPALGVSLEVPKLKVKAAHILADWLPKVTLYNEIDYSLLHRDQELLKEYRNDPLRHEKISPRLFLGMTSSFTEAFDHAGEIHQPVLMQLAGVDKIVSTPEAERFFDLLGSKKKEILVYAESYHEIFNDLGREEVIGDLKDFLKRTSGVENDK